MIPWTLRSVIWQNVVPRSFKEIKACIFIKFITRTAAIGCRRESPPRPVRPTVAYHVDPDAKHPHVGPRRAIFARKHYMVSVISSPGKMECVCSLIFAELRAKMHRFIHRIGVLVVSYLISEKYCYSMCFL